MLWRNLTSLRTLLRAVVSSSLALFGSLSFAGVISLVGQLDPNNAQDVFMRVFTLSAPTTVTLQSWGYGGTLNAPGGTNAAGGVIAAGGFDPYLSVFAGSGTTGTLLASNDDGTCPPGAPSGVSCFDSALTLPLPAGTYTVALSTFENMSFAENLGTGTLGDGFINLGSFNGRSNDFAVDISGAAVVVPALSFGYVPNALTFGPQTLNLASGPLTVIVTNTGNAAVALGAFTLGGTAAAEFAAGGDCTSSLGVGASCTISVTFDPTVSGLRMATLTVGSNAPQGPALIELQGTGTTNAVASAALSATSLDFGMQPLGKPSSQLLVVTNTGGAPLTIGANSEGGSNPRDFVITDNCAGQTLAAGASCTLQVVFTTGVAAPRAATLTINSNASNNPVTVTLRGTGYVPAIPTLNRWGLLLLSLSLALGAAFALRRIAGRMWK